MNAPIRHLTDIGSSEVFRLWSEQQLQLAVETGGKKGCSAKSAANCMCIWESWVQWLAGQEDPVLTPAAQRWAVALQAHVQAFLDGPAPKQSTRKAKKSSELANFSQQRYWRVLRDVYAHAIALGARLDNPALDLPKTPSIERGSRKPQVMPPFVLQLLRDGHQLRELVPQGRVAWLTARDRAAIAVLATCGITASELGGLKGADLRGLSESGRRQPTLPGQPRPAVKLDVAGRTLEVPSSAVPLLQDWLDFRQHVLDRQRREAVRLARRSRTEPAPAAMTSDEHQPLFLSRETSTGAHANLDPASLYKIVKRCLRRAYARPEIAGMLEPGSYTAAGPAIIRNTVIKGWIEQARRRPGCRNGRIDRATGLHIAQRTPLTGVGRVGP